MLSLAKLGRGREDYYLRAVGADASQYYSERGEVAGRWLGGGAEVLGLRGQVQGQVLLALLAGYEPGAQQQGKGWAGRRLVAPPKTGRRTPGFDACFKAPKSVSLLWAFGDRVRVGERTLDQVVQMAHDEAVREALSYLEASAAKGRRGRDGVVQMDSSGFMAAVFRQRTSRAGDPHLHSHVLIANMCQGGDGRWGALDARLIYVYAKAAGYLYETHLRYRLSGELGADWTDVANGIADVLGVPEEMIDHFSKRSKEIRGRLDEVTERINEDRVRLGLAPVEADSQEALDIAARETRATKLQHVATADLRTGWREEADAAGLDAERLVDVLHRADTQPPVTVDGDLHRRVSAGLTEHASTFGRRDAVQGMAADARRGIPVTEALERTSAMLTSGEVIPVVGAVRDQDVIRRADGAVAPVPTGERRWSTPDMLAVEERLVANALRRQEGGVALVPSGLLDESLRDSLERLPSLGLDQVEMARRLASSGAGVECVEAAPGTGKTTALGVYVAACRRAGIAMIGCAPSARARDELRLGARIDPSYTVDKLLIVLARDRLEPGSVVVLDEASLAGSRKLGLLLDHAAASGAKVVLVGDTKQLSSVDAGGGFRGLVARLGAHRLLDNRRQVEAWEREALRHLRDGRVRPAMTAYAAHGRLHIGDREQLMQGMVDDWWASRSSGEAVMQASGWRDVLELNELARERLVEAGLVERDGLDVRGVTVGVGDQVMVLRNAPALGVINGTMGTVTAIDREHGDLLVQTIEPEPQAVRLPASFWNAKGRRRMALAYCRTIHKAQGSTYRGASFTLAGDDTIHLEAMHVALSRGTQANHLYYMGEPPPDEDHHVVEVERAEFEGLVAAVGRSRAQVMALDVLEGLVALSGVGGTAGRWTEAPMTEAQVAVLARRAVVPEGDLTWVQASLLIDQATGAPVGQRATTWLRENGASAEEAAQVIEREERALRAPPGDRQAEAVAVRLEVLDGAASGGRRLSGGEAREREALQRRRKEAIRDHLRQRRRAWAQRPQSVENGRQSGQDATASAANRASGSRPPPRAGR
jgi:conjugative relaxase-like TrwC/TraI family protein